MKKLISLFMAVVMLFGIGAEAFAAYEGDKVHAYESADCTIIYSITNEWTGNQQVSVSITNNSEETLRNWAIKFDNTGTISNIWNASVLENDGELCVIRNNGYNYEITPDATIEFGFMQQGESLSLPESVTLCSKTADSTASAEISYEIQNNWGEGFIAAVTIKNITDKPLEAWKLSFNGNFEISAIWNANLLYTEDDSFRVENDVTTTPIAVGETKTFSFEGAIASGAEPVMTDFMLTSVVIDMEAETGDSGETEDLDTPTEPDEPTESEEPVILCFGEYLADENALEVYWYSTAQGTVSVYENTNDNGWVKLVDVTDEDSYKYEITEDFLVKYIKVKLETESGTIESEPFIVAYTEDGYVCTWLDTDEDGLPDYAEKIYGTDPENPDTDSDGLSDYDELYTVGTSPLKYDTDKDGTNDADSDLDSDDLTNVQELELGTSPSSADTDGDTLSDFAELHETDTDPLKADTDGDTLSDSDDIALGLDPNDPETFDVPDAEYKVEQTISADSEVMERVNTDEAPYELSLEITASGNVGANLIAGNSIYSTITESSARLGGAVDLSYLSGEVDKVKLIYEVSEDYISNDGSEYAENCVDLQGIKRYNIFRYFEDINMLLPVATEFDVENNTLYAETDKLGTYCVLDMEILLQNLGIAPDGTQTETVMAEYYSAAELSEASVLAVSDETTEAIDSSDTFYSAEKYYVTFIIDVRQDALDDLTKIKEQISEFAETAYIERKDVSIRLLPQGAFDFTDDSDTYSPEEISERTYTSLEAVNEALDDIKIEDDNEYFGNYYQLTDVLGEVANVSEYSNHNFIFNIYSQTDAVYEQNNINTLLESAAENSVSISAITTEYPLEGFQSEMIADSNGTHIVGYATIADEVYEHVFNGVYVEKEALPVILATGYQKVVLDSKLYPNGYWGGVGTDADTDRDTITDWDEVKTELLTINGIGDYELPTVRQCVAELSKVPFYIEGALDRDDIIYRYWGCKVLPINSDPTCEDGDGDGELDDIDPNPCNFQINETFLHNIKKLEEYTESYLNETTKYDNVDTNKYNGRLSEWLIFSYLRYFKIYTPPSGETLHYYAVNNWPGIAGDIDFDYISYIESKDSNLSDYFSVTNQLNSNPNQSNIDLFHMAATISALLYSSEWSDGNGIVDSIKHQFMFEYHLDNLAGWAGDFQQIVHDSAYKAKSEGVDFFDEICSAMGSDDSRFSYSDWVTDADAVNIVNKINSSNNSLYEILKNYYNFGLNNRFTEFAKTFTRSDVACYANYKFMSVVIWPIYDYSTDDEEYVKISLNQSGEATAAFMIYLEDLIVNETKN